MSINNSIKRVHGSQTSPLRSIIALFLFTAGALMPAQLMAQTDAPAHPESPAHHEAPDAPMAQPFDADNGVVTIGADRMFQIESKDHRFSFKPYLMLQTSVNYNYYDDEGLDKAYNQDNVANSGFAIPYAVLGFTGKAFSNITYNLSINAAASGANILQQAWFDVRFRPALSLRVGKFKTPFASAYLTTLGETLMPMLPTSLTATVIMPYSLNAVNPTMATGFDLGVMLHGVVRDRFTYQVGLFNGNGSGSNSATKTFSDDWHIPSLLYAGRVAWTPFGAMPRTQGNAKLQNLNRLEVALSGSINVESESESTNDTRAGLEVTWLCRRLFLSAEAYMMHVGFTDRQKIDDTYNFFGGYVQAGYFVHPLWQITARYDFMDRNGSGTDGILNSPAAGFNFFMRNSGVKISGMYQYTGRTGHKTQLDRDNDDLGLAMHAARVMIQYTF